LHITATYNAHTYDRYFAPVFARFPTLEQSLLEDFITYKATGKLPHYFGRDTLYDRPDEIKAVQLRHMHFELGNNMFKPLAELGGKRPHTPDPSTVQWYKTSDTCLVYIQNIVDEHCYSLLAVFHPWAHAEGQDYKQMKELAAIAEKFRVTIF